MRLTRQGLGVLILALLLAAPASAARFRVKCNQGQKISNALKHARPGDTIVVRGTCSENVTVTVDDLTIDGKGTGVLDGAGGDALSIDGAHRVRIQDLTVRHGSIGIFVAGAASATVDNVTLPDNDRALQVTGGSSVRMDRAIVISGAADFGLIADSSATVIFEDTADVTVRDNGGVGVLVGASATFLVDGGSTLRTHDNGSDGVLLIGGATLSVEATSTFESQNNGGNGLNMLANSFLSTDPGGSIVTLTSNTGAGLALDDGSSALFFGATVTGNSGAADVVASRLSRGTLFGNTIGTLACDGTALVSGDTGCP